MTAADRCHESFMDGPSGKAGAGLAEPVEDSTENSLS